PVLDRAQVHERVTQQAAERRREIPALGEAEDRAQRVALAQPRVVPRVEELERLDQELDLADAAGSEFHVPPFRFLAAERAVDSGFRPPDLAHDLQIAAGSEDEGSGQIEETPRHPGIASREAGLDQGLPFPELRAVADVLPIAVEREDQGAHSTFRPES